MILVASRRSSASSLRFFIFSWTCATLRRYHSGCRRSCGLVSGMVVAMRKKCIRPNSLMSVVILSAATPESVRINSLRFAIGPPPGKTFCHFRAIHLSVPARLAARGQILILGGAALQPCIEDIVSVRLQPRGILRNRVISREGAYGRKAVFLATQETSRSSRLGGEGTRAPRKLYFLRAGDDLASEPPMVRYSPRW